MDNIWFCKLLLLFAIESKDVGSQHHVCISLFVMQEYTGCQNKLHMRLMIHMQHTENMANLEHMLTTCAVLLVQFGCLNENHQ